MNHPPLTNTAPHCTAPGYYCPPGSYRAAQVLCGGAALYCPEGSPEPLRAPAGYYTWSSDTIEVVDRGDAGSWRSLKYYNDAPDLVHAQSSASLCEPGHYCVAGVRRVCPGGTYGAVGGLATPDCDGPCRGGFYCPAGAIRATQLRCGGPHVFCPVGSPEPKPVRAGYYTFSHYRISDDPRCQGGACDTLPPPTDVHSDEHQCELGHYCNNGTRYDCPAGTFGDRWGLLNASCSGLCAPGYYCPAQSHIATQRECGSTSVFCPEGSGMPTIVSLGYFSVAPASFGAVPRLEHVEPPSLRWHDWPELLFPALRTDRQNAGRVRSFVVVEGDDPNQRTRSRQLVCPRGAYCIQGDRRLCPAGRFGDVEGLSSRDCSGQAPGGYFAPAGTVNATQYPCSDPGFFCPPGSGSPTPVPPGWYSTHPSMGEYDLDLAMAAEGGSNDDVAEEAALLRTTVNQCHRGNVSGSAASSADSTVTVSASSRVLCSGLPYVHNAMHWRLHGDAGYEAYRIGIRMCPPGAFCPGVAGDGHRWEMPPGRYASSPGVSNYLGQGTGVCAPGHYCPAGSVTPVERRCGSPRLAPVVHEVQVISTASLWEGSPRHRRGGGASGSFVVAFDTTQRRKGAAADGLPEVEWNRVQTSTVECRAPCRRLVVQGIPSPPPAVAHDATAADVKHALELLPNVGVVKVSRSVVSEEDHTFAWSVTFMTVLGDVPTLQARASVTPAPAAASSSPESDRGTRTDEIDEHAQQHLHEYVHSERFDLTGVSLSVVEQVQGRVRVVEPPRGADVFCPEGSGNPTPVSVGYYTNLRYRTTTQVAHPTVGGGGSAGSHAVPNSRRWEPVRSLRREGRIEAAGLVEPSQGRSGANDEMAYEQVECEVGHWCDAGLRDACPRGRYGGVRGLISELCSGPCAPGYLCPHGSYLATQVECGYGLDEPSAVYCPPGLATASWKPTPVTAGYYTTGGNPVTNRTRFAQSICEPGHYCVGGRKIRCPSGRYSPTTGAFTSDCAGLCHAGYFCPQGSSSPTQVECGSERGVRAPCAVRQRDGESPLTAHTGERRCEDDHGAMQTRDQTYSQGTGHVSVHHQETEDYTMVNPRQYHYHTTRFHTSRVRYSGMASSVYCPNGSAVPLQVTAGYYTIGGNNTHNRTRQSQLRVEAGFFAEAGRKYQCPPGRYGHTRGLTTEFCSGFCPPGFYCPWNTSEPIACAEGTYAQAGSMVCTSCPQRPASTLGPETCRTGRHCCFK